MVPSVFESHNDHNDRYHEVEQRLNVYQEKLQATDS